MQYREKQAESDSLLKKMKKEVEKGKKELDSVQVEMDKTSEDFKDFERRDVKFREDLKFMKSKMKKASEKATKEEKKREAAVEEAKSLKDEIPRLEDEIAEATKGLEPAEKKQAKLEEGIQSEVNGYRMELEKVQSELVPWEKKIAEAKAKVDLHESSKETLEQKHRGAEEALETAIQNLKKAEEAHREKEVEFETLNSELDDEKKTIQSLLEEDINLNKECTRLTNGVRSMKANYQEQKAARDAVKSQGQVMAALLAAKSSGKIPGIWGRLGDLGAVDKRYDVAASTSSGALDYIVVNDTGTAQKCVTLLREKGLGVATFLILDKQKHLIASSQEKVVPPEGSQRLFDLIKVAHDEIKPAFFFAFRNTVVAEDLDQATRIAYGNDKKWRRVVTIDGQLIESTGTMSGGGNKPKGGRICVGSVKKVHNPDLIDTDASDSGYDEKRLKSFEKELKTCQKSIKDLQSKLREAKDRKSEIELSLKKIEAEMTSYLENIESLKCQIDNLKEEAIVPAEDIKTLKTLSKEIAKANNELDKQRQGAASLHKEVDRLRSFIDEAGGKPLKDARARVIELREIVETARKELPQIRVKISSQEKCATKAEKASKDAEEEAEKLGQEIETLKDSFKSIESEALVVMEKLKEAQTCHAEKAAALKELTARYDTKKEEDAMIRTTNVDIESKLEDCARSLNEEGTNVAHWESELEKCASHLRDSADDSLSVNDEELESYSIDDAKYKVTMVEAELEKMRPDMSAIDAYKKKDSEYADRLAGLEEISSNREEKRVVYDALRRKRLDEFMAGFNIISMKLKEMYQMITLGGDAELELVDSLDPFSEGIVFSVRPPKKSWKNICNLSGGEKTLSSLALVFALHHFKPTPLYVMDEIDAALDFKNVSIVAHYIKERTKDAQFVIISLRNNMFELADRLVGIYKTNNCTKSVTINPGSFTVGQQNSQMLVA